MDTCSGMHLNALITQVTQCYLGELTLNLLLIGVSPEQLQHILLLPLATLVLHPKTWNSAKLVEIRQVNHDSFIFQFSLARPDQPFGLPTGQHVFIRIRGKGTGEMIQRAYTPISEGHCVGTVDVLVK